MGGNEFFVSSILSLWINSLLYGMHVILFAGIVYLHVQQPIRKWFITAAYTLFLLSSAQAVLALLYVALSPSVLNDGLSEARIHEVIRRDLLDCISTACYLITTIIADVLLIYRCYVIWQSRVWVVILPAVLLVANIAVTGHCTAYYVQLYLSSASDYITISGPVPRFDALNEVHTDLGIVQLCILVCINLIVTALIAYKIWSVGRQVRATLGPQMTLMYFSVISIVVESGALILVTSTILLVVCLKTVDIGGTQNLGTQNLGFYMVVPMAPTLIIGRAALGRDSARAVTDMSGMIDSSALNSRNISFARPQSVC